MLDNFPDNLHPMAQFVAAIAALNNESKFAAAYARGVPKSSYWEYAYEVGRVTHIFRAFLETS